MTAAVIGRAAPQTVPPGTTPHGITPPGITPPTPAATRVLAARPEVELHDLYDAAGSAIYHDIAGRDTYEIREILAVVRRHPGDVLDLAAGSGRLTLPLLAAGRRVTAVDLSHGMLAILRERLQKLPAGARERCTTVLADVRRVALGRRFAVVLLGTTTISLLDTAGRAQLYRRVREHLAPAGVFAITTVDLPDTGDADERESTVQGASGRRYRMFEHYVPGSSTRQVTILCADSPVVATTSIGVLPPDDLAAELRDAGFGITERICVAAPPQQHRSTLLVAPVAPVAPAKGAS